MTLILSWFGFSIGVGVIYAWKNWKETSPHPVE